MPLLAVMFLFSFIDRQNVGFAKLDMVRSLHMSEAAYGFGASLFFIGYLIFEIPSTLALHRFGARTWLARIMFSWGLVTIGLGFTRSLPMFYSLRFLLGVAEAGFYPGVVYYLTLWFPRAYRTKMLGYFTLGSAVANLLGSFLGGLLLDLNGVFGLAGWQWVFVATGLPAVLLTMAALSYLPGSPEEAQFLTAEERLRLESVVKREIAPGVIRGHPLAALWDLRVWFFSGTYMCLSTSLYGVTYWLPTLVKGFGVTSMVNGLLNTIPWGLAVLLLLWLPGKLKNDGIVFRAIAVISFIGLVCFCSSALLGSNATRFAALALGGACIPLLYPCFWSLPPKFFLGARAAASIAAINSIGNLGGFAAQNLMPYIGHAAHRDISPMLVPAACLTILGAGAALAILREPRRS
jgi:MFS family permease